MQPAEQAKLKNAIAFLKPDKKRSLLKLLSAQVTEAMLLDIARGFGPGYKVKENLDALRMTIANYEIPATDALDYEVLRSESYSDPENYKDKEQYEHLKRAFCCTILITANSLHNNGYYDLFSSDVNDEYYLIRLIESCNYLGKDFLLQIIGFLAWQINEVKLNADNTWNNPIFLTSLFALIYLLLKTGYPVAETDLKILVNYLNNIQTGNYYRDWWVFDNFLQAKVKWKKLAMELSMLVKKLKDKDLKKELDEILDKVLLNE